MSYVSYNTDLITKSYVTALAQKKGIAYSSVVRQALKAYLHNVQDERRLRLIGCTVLLNSEQAKILHEVSKSTNMSKSLVIHQCLVRYLYEHFGNFHPVFFEERDEFDIAI